MNLLEEQPKIKVVVRKRPLSRKEGIKGETDIVEVRNASSVIVREMKSKVDLTKFIDEHHFNFDSAFSQSASNQMVYQECVRPIVQCAFLGAKVTCFAYGQTGSGKTYTMNGDIGSQTPGMYVLGAQDIFAIKQQIQFKHLSVAMSFYEIYCGKLYDLLNNREVLQAREDAKQNVNIIGLTEKKILNVHNFMQVIQQGSAVRITSQNSTNADSSRSHAILQISLIQGKKIFGKISFIDLAGCERGADTIDQNKQTRIDGAEINKSLLALKECIRALDNGKAHTPFRGSKLTMVLKDSFTGFCKTLMIGNISPNSASCQNTLNTLRYADRVKQLKKPSNQHISKEDQLAKELMLPRMLKNKQTVQINSDEEEEIQQINHLQQIQDIKQIHEIQQEAQRMGHRKTLIETKMEEQPLLKLKSNRDTQMMNKKKVSMNRDQNCENLYRMNQQKEKEKRGHSVINKNGKIPNPLLNNIMHKNKQLIGPLKTSINTTSQHQKSTNQLHNSTTEILKQKIGQKKSFPMKYGNSNNMTNYVNQQISQHRLDNSQYNQWENIFEQFRIWEPSNKSQMQVQSFTNKFEILVNFIMREEIQVLGLHKSELETNSVFHKEQLKLYNNIVQEDKTNQEFMDYVENLEVILDKKINLLFHLKNKLGSYKYHLKEHELCEKKLFKASDELNDCCEQQEVESMIMDQNEEIFSESEPKLFQQVNSIFHPEQSPFFINNFNRSQLQQYKTNMYFPQQQVAQDNTYNQNFHNNNATCFQQQIMMPNNQTGYNNSNIYHNMASAHQLQGITNLNIMTSNMMNLQSTKTTNTNIMNYNNHLQPPPPTITTHLNNHYYRQEFY